MTCGCLSRRRVTVTETMKAPLYSISSFLKTPSPGNMGTRKSRAPGHTGSEPSMNHTQCHSVCARQLWEPGGPVRSIDWFPTYSKSLQGPGKIRPSLDLPTCLVLPGTCLTAALKVSHPGKTGTVGSPYAFQVRKSDQRGEVVRSRPSC